VACGRERSAVKLWGRWAMGVSASFVGLREPGKWGNWQQGWRVLVRARGMGTGGGGEVGQGVGVGGG